MLVVEGAVPRDRTAAWLWPDVPQRQANLSLRQRIFRLRRQCGHLLIEASATLRLAEGVHVDLRQTPLPDEGELLAGLDFGRWEAFDQWLQAARRPLRHRQCERLDGRAAQLEARGEFADALALCERILSIEPVTEHVWRRLMRLHWLRADRAAAIAAFERFEQQVCREHGLRPSAETLDLLERVERLDAAERSAIATLPPGLMRPPLLVGRHAALQALDQAWASGRAALLLAAGGMGKSRLLEAHGQGRSGVLMGRARPGDVTHPYATLAHVLADALDRYAPVLVPEVRAELARLLPSLGPAPSAPAAPRQLGRCIEQAWQACMAQGLSALLIDDLHWADTASVEQLHAQLASPALAALRCAFAARPEEDTPALPLLRGWLGDSLRIVPIALQAWHAAQLQELLPTLGLPPALAGDAQLADRLVQQTGGQPFFVLELLKVLCDNERGSPGAALPPVVGAAIARRIQALPDSAGQLLQLLSIAQGNLRLEAAARVLHRPLIALVGDWGALAAAQLVHPNGVAHDLVREAVLATLPEPARQALHLALAQALAETPGVRPAALADHWQAAGAWQEAARAWTDAARLAVGAGRLADANQLFTRAGDAARWSGDAQALVDVLAAAQTTRLGTEGPDAVAASLAELATTLSQPGPRVRLLMLISEAEMARMRFAEAAASIGEAVALAAQLPGGTALQADLNIQHGRVIGWNGDTERGVALLRQACREADALGDPRRRLLARTTLSDVLVPARRRVESVQSQREALALARELGDAYEHALCASNLAVFQFLVADADGAYRASREALRAFQGMGVSHLDRVMCTTIHAYAAAHAGRFDEAAESVAPFLGAAAEDGATDSVLRNLRNVCSTVALWRGELVEARALLPPANDQAALSVKLTGLQAHLRWLAWTDADAAACEPWRAELQAMGKHHPELRDDPHFYRSWAPWDPPMDAVARLDRLAAQAQQEGAAAMARTLAVVALQILLPLQPEAAGSRAKALLPELDQGMHPALYPPEAWWSLAQALAAVSEAGAAAQALGRARHWIEAARLPTLDAAQQRRFLHDNPVNRAVFDCPWG